MRLDQSKGRTAAEILATCSVEELTEIIEVSAKNPLQEGSHEKLYRPVKLNRLRIRDSWRNLFEMHMVAGRRHQEWIPQRGPSWDSESR